MALRALFAFLAASLLSLAAVAQSDDPPSVRWRVNASNTLLWAGEPYLPIGLRIEGNPEAVERARAAGFTDVLVTLPATGDGWDETVEALEAAGMRYVVEFTSLAPAAFGVAVEPEGYRIPKINAPINVDFAIPGADRTLSVLALERDGSVAWNSVQELTDGRYALSVNPNSTLDHVLLVYPQVRELRIPDAWEAFDAHRDRLLGLLSRQPFGPGLRGIVNPIGSLVRFPNPDTYFVPMSPLFRLEFESFLKERYGAVETLQRAWSMSYSGLNSYAELARLVPLWSESRGVSQMWDPLTDKLYPCDRRDSLVWSDIRAVLARSMAERYENLTASVQRMSGVPVIQDWTGWAGPYASPRPRLDGIGFKAVAESAPSLVEQVCRPASTLLRWPGSGWFVATGLRVPDDGLGLRAADALEETASLGARAWFFAVDDPAGIEAVARLARSGPSDSELASWRPSAVFFPESARNPAVPMRLIGGRWWLPSPADGNRVDLGSMFAAYRYRSGNDAYVAIWSRVGPQRVKLRLSSTDGVTVEALNGSDPDVRMHKNGLDVNLSETPILVRGTDEIPIPETAYRQALVEYDALKAEAASRQTPLPDQASMFSRQMAGFERNPGGAFLEVRETLSDLHRSLTPHVWIDLELTRDTTMSEARVVPGTSGNRVLTAFSRLPATSGSMYTRYRFSSRNVGPNEIWLAAKIDPADLAGVSIRVGDQILRAEGRPTSLYAGGFGWYRFGRANLGETVDLQIVVEGRSGTLIEFDALVLSPGGFRPDGVAQPYALEPPVPR